MPLTVLAHTLPLLWCLDVGTLESGTLCAYSSFLVAHGVPLSVHAASLVKEVVFDRLFAARVLPERATGVLLDALVRIDVSRRHLALNATAIASSAETLHASLPLTERALMRVANLWRTASFSAHASIEHHRHVAVSVLHALRRVCECNRATGASANASTATAASPPLTPLPLPRTPAQLADWARSQKQKSARGDDDEADLLDLEATGRAGEPLSLSASYQRLLTAGVVGDILEGVTMRLQSPLPAYRKLAMQVAESFSLLVDPSQPLRFDDDAATEILAARDADAACTNGGAINKQLSVHSSQDGQQLEQAELAAEAKTKDWMRRRQELLFAAEFGERTVDVDLFSRRALPDVWPWLWHDVRVENHNDGTGAALSALVLLPFVSSDTADVENVAECEFESLAVVFSVRMQGEQCADIANLTLASASEVRMLDAVDCIRSEAPALAIVASNAGVNSVSGSFSGHENDDNGCDEIDEDDLKPLHAVNQQSLGDLAPHRSPLYLRDLWAHIRATDDVARQEAALRGAAALIRQCPADLTDVATGLLDSVLAWGDVFHLPLFAQRQRAAAIALAVCAPAQCSARLVSRMYVCACWVTRCRILLGFPFDFHSATAFVYIILVFFGFCFHSLLQIWRRIFAR